MYVQVVTFGLNGITDEEYKRGVESLTEPIASLPGLLAKIWLRNRDANIYGGVYLWEDRQAYESYIKGEIFRSIGSNAAFKNAHSQDFEVIEELTKATQPQMAIVRELVRSPS